MYAILLSNWHNDPELCGKNVTTTKPILVEEDENGGYIEVGKKIIPIPMTEESRGYYWDADQQRLLDPLEVEMCGVDFARTVCIFTFPEQDKAAIFHNGIRHGCEALNQAYRNTNESV